MKMTTIEAEELLLDSVTVLPVERRCDRCDEVVALDARYCGSCGSLASARAESDTTPLGGFDLSVTARARVVVLNGDGSVRRAVPLYGDGLTIGAAGCELMLENDPYIAPQHCRIFRTERGWEVEDLGTINGVFQQLNASATVRAGAVVRMGAQLFRIAAHDELFGQRPPLLPPTAARFFGSPAAKPSIYLCQILETRRAGALSSLSDGRPFVLGRTAGDWTFPSDAFMSSRHASFACSPDGSCELRDLGSRNGVFLRLEGRAELGRGATLLVGETVLKFEVS